MIPVLLDVLEVGSIKKHPEVGRQFSNALVLAFLYVAGSQVPLGIATRHVHGSKVSHLCSPALLQLGEYLRNALGRQTHAQGKIIATLKKMRRMTERHRLGFERHDFGKKLISVALCPACFYGFGIEPGVDLGGEGIIEFPLHRPCTAPIRSAALAKIIRRARTIISLLTLAL